MTKYYEQEITGQYWLPQMPQHWKIERAKFLFSERNDKGFENEPLLAATQSKGVILKDDYENRTVLATKDLHNLKLVEVGDFVISLRSFQGGIEYSYARGIISPAYTILKLQEGDEGYFKHLFKSYDFIKLLKTLVTGIREGQNIDTNLFKNSFLPVPPPSEQTAIANFLDHKCAQIDRFISKKQELIARLEEKKQAVINQAVTKGLDPTVKMKPSGVEWLGNVPEHWGVRKLKYLVTYNDEALSDVISPDFTLRYIDIGNVEQNGNIIEIATYKFKDAPSRARRIVRQNDVIISTVRTYLKAITQINESSEDLIVSTGFVVLRPKKSIVSDFLNYGVKADYFIENVCAESYGVSYPAINASELVKIRFVYPPIDEQTEIVNFIKKEISEIDTAITRIQEEITLIGEYKNALISEAVTGKIDVRAWQPKTTKTAAL